MDSIYLYDPDAPEIEVEQSWIRTGSGIEAQVSCSVHSEPRAEVRWYKDTMLLEPNNNRHMESFGNRHVLTIRNVRETDFGNYSCAADNSLGRERGFTDVSGESVLMYYRSTNINVKDWHLAFSKTKGGILLVVSPKIEEKVD